MTYRDENEALRAQLEEAERKLATLEEENRALRIVPPPSGRPNWLAGGPTRLDVKRDVPGELSESDHDAIAEALGDRADRMQVNRVGRTLEIRFGAFEGRDLLMRIAPKKGRTTISVRERHYALMGGIYGGGLGGFGGGGLGFVLPLTILGTESAPITISVAFAWLLGAFSVARYAYRRIATRREQEAHQLLAVVERAVADAIAARQPNVRVRASASDPGDSVEAPPQLGEAAPEQGEIAAVERAAREGTKKARNE